MRPSPLTRVRSRELRQEQTPAERAMWTLLRDHRLGSLKFRRQYPIGIFIVDFCCRERKLVVELDGEVHDSDPQRAWDENRDIYLQQRGFKVLRFRNESVFEDPDSILQRIFEAAR
ncbi:MAG: endonuclease domain-containing protein [Thermoanaerobaculia bacterium]